MADLLDPILGGQGGVLVRFLFMFLIILAIFTLIVWLIGRLSSLRFYFKHRRQQRLEVIDSVQVDARRRALLLRRDNVEHLIIVGGPTDIVVEHRPLGDDRDRLAPADRRPAGERAAERREPARGPVRGQPARPQPAAPSERLRQVVRREAADPAGPRQDLQPQARPDGDGAHRRDLAAFGGEPPRPAAPRQRPTAQPERLPDRPAAPPAEPVRPPQATGPEPDLYAKRMPDATDDLAALISRPETPDAWGDAVPRTMLEPAAHDAAEDEEEAAAEFVAAVAPHRGEAHTAQPAAPGAGPDSETSPLLREPPHRREDVAVPPVRTDERFAATSFPGSTGQETDRSRPPPLYAPQPPAPPVRPQRHHDDDDVSSAERVGRLEEEMARLLSEITTKRRAGS